MSVSNSDANRPYEDSLCEQRTHDAEQGGIHVVLGFNIDLTLLRKQKRVLLEICEGRAVNYEQEEAAKGLLNFIDFIQDSMVEQGIATEEEVFPHFPQLFEEQPKPATKCL